MLCCFRAIAGSCLGSKWENEIMYPSVVLRKNVVHFSSNHVSLPTMSSDLNTKFMQVYDSVKSNIIQDPSFEFDDYSRQWVERVHFRLIILLTLLFEYICT